MVTIIDAFLLGLACAVISVSMIVVMPKEPILNWWFVLGTRLGTYQHEGQERERWFYHPIWGCEKCFAGQIALWVYLIGHARAQVGVVAAKTHGAVLWVGFENYSLFCQLIAVCSAILFAVFVSSITKKIINNAN